MERRVLIAVFLSFVVLYAYQAIFVPPPPPSKSPSSPQSSQAPGTPAAQPADSAPPPVAIAPASSKPVVGESTERDVVVDTATVRAVFTNRGGRIKQWLLKMYR